MKIGLENRRGVIFRVIELKEISMKDHLDFCLFLESLGLFDRIGDSPAEDESYDHVFTPGTKK